MEMLTDTTSLSIDPKGNVRLVGLEQAEVFDERKAFAELESLASELVEETGRGGPTVVVGQLQKNVWLQRPGPNLSTQRKGEIRDSVRSLLALLWSRRFFTPFFS
jgi:hypothetical protein